MAKIKGQVRRSQLITTYGVGSIVAVEDESFMVAGLDRWPVDLPNLHEPRLERMLHVSGFVLPPATENGNDVPVVRFPRWAYCPACHRLDEHRYFAGLFENRCKQCGVSLIPSRFVICCSKGHIDDFPYFSWIHAGRKRTANARHELHIESGGNTASLRSIKISCICGAERTMEGAFARNALGGIKQCSAERPWIGRKDENCDETPRTLQRGASNVWFSVTQSAISIPPWSELAFKILNRHWRTLQAVPDAALRGTIEGMDLAAGTPYSVDDLVFAVRRRREASGQETPESVAGLRSEEYEALCRGFEENSKDQDFVCVPAPKPRPGVARWFGQVMQVKRLREVRALCSFSRVNPPAAGMTADAPPLYDEDPGWLPGIEVIGEGVFLRLSQEALEQWEARVAVRDRAKRIDGNYRQRCERYGVDPDRTITPRLLLIHTLAHALIGQWALDAGYPASSLRERLYVSATMAGLLIYTATSDSAGSLGGVIAQAEPDAFDESLGGAIQTAAWCSSDPLCLEADAAGVDSLNLAACHACVLLPEVSCEEMNLFLDRAVLIGTPEAPELGFFRDLVE